MQEFTELNAELAEVWPNIAEKEGRSAPLKSGDGVPDKLQYLGA